MGACSCAGVVAGQAKPVDAACQDSHASHAREGSEPSKLETENERPPGWWQSSLLLAQVLQLAAQACEPAAVVRLTVAVHRVIDWHSFHSP